MKDLCYMLKPSQGGGGNKHARNAINGNGAVPLIVRRTAALGDSLSASVVASRLMQLGFEVVMQTHSACHCVIRKVEGLYDVTEPKWNPHVNLDNTYERHPRKKWMHFHEMFYEAANLQLEARGIHLGEPRNCKPHISVRPVDKQSVFSQFSQYDRPWVMVCPRSDAYNVRQVPDGIWEATAAMTSGTKFWLGRHPAPKNFIDLKCQHFDNVINYLSCADLLITVDTGPMHVAAALGVPVVAICQSSSPELHLNDQNDYVSISPPLDCLGCMENRCPKNPHLPPCQTVAPELISSWANARLDSIFGDKVSAIVPIYKPESKTLNRCLECVLPQVNEVIVCCQADSVIPNGVVRHNKIRFVHHRLPKLGYGRNTNHGVRNSNGRYLMLLNDDVFLEPDAVSKCMAEMKSGVGMVSHFLKYPDGTIYHAGKRRTPGLRGWGHIDHKKYIPEITEPQEHENTCGASVLVRRDVFYKIDGFDEDFFLYAEDDSFCLALRRAGYKIIYTPHAKGTHMEHQSTQKLGDVMSTVRASNSLFGQKWGRYLDHNINNDFGSFDY